MTLPDAHTIQTSSAKTFRTILNNAEPDDRPWMLYVRARRDILLFARLAAHHALRRPFAPFHRMLFQWHRRMMTPVLEKRNGLRFALAAPRGSAKSTIVSWILPLHDIVYETERYIILLSATQRQARQRLAALRRELTGDTPLTRWVHPRFKKTPVTSSADTLTVGRMRIDACGGGSEIRGITHNAWRPTKIILDDAESSAAAESSRRRARLHDWFGEVIEHLGASYTHILAIGTVLHPESLLSTLLQRTDFEPMRCKAIESFADPSPHWNTWRSILTDRSLHNRRKKARTFFMTHREDMQQGARVLWPEQEDYEQLMAQLVVQGRRTFYQEKQNEPLGPEDALFTPETCWRAQRTAAGWRVMPPDKDPARVREYPDTSLRRFGYHDAALGKPGHKVGDFAALATVALAEDGTLILESIWLKRAAPTEQIDAMFDAHELRPFEQLAIEGTGFQELLTIPVEDERRRREQHARRSDLPVVVIKPRRAKHVRIASLEPTLSNARLILADTLPEEFRTELARYPRCDHDDALDAVAGAVEIAMQRAGLDETTTLNRIPRPRRHRNF